MREKLYDNTNDCDHSHKDNNINIYIYIYLSFFLCKDERKEKTESAKKAKNLMEFITVTCCQLCVTSQITVTKLHFLF